MVLPDFLAASALSCTCNKERLYAVQARSWERSDVHVVFDCFLAFSRRFVCALSCLDMLCVGTYEISSNLLWQISEHLLCDTINIYLFPINFVISTLRLDLYYFYTFLSPFLCNKYYLSA